MRYPTAEFLRMTALLCGLTLTGHAQGPVAPKPRGAVQNFVPVTDQAIRTPKPEDWLLYRGNYQGWGYSPLEQINKAFADSEWHGRETTTITRAALVP